MKGFLLCIGVGLSALGDRRTQPDVISTMFLTLPRL